MSADWTYPYHDNDDETNISMLVKGFYNQKRFKVDSICGDVDHFKSLYPHFQLLASITEEASSIKRQFYDLQVKLVTEATQSVQEVSTTTAEHDGEKKRRVEYQALSSKKQRRSVYAQVDKVLEHLGYHSREEKVTIFEDLLRYQWYAQEIRTHDSVLDNLLSSTLHALSALRCVQADAQMNNELHVNIDEVTEVDDNMSVEYVEPIDNAVVNGERDRVAHLLEQCCQFSNFTAAIKNMSSRYTTYTDKQKDSVLRCVRVAKAINNHLGNIGSDNEVVLCVCKLIRQNISGYEDLETRNVKNWIHSAETQKEQRGVKMCKEFIVEVFNELIVAETEKVLCSVSALNWFKMSQTAQITCLFTFLGIRKYHETYGWSAYS